MNFGTAVTYLTNCVDWVRCIIDTSLGGCDKNYVAGIIAGLIYFDKVKWFLEDTGLGVTERQFSMLRTNNNDIVGGYILKIANGLIGQSEKAFKRDNIGWTSYNDDRFAFDSVNLLAEWLGLQEQYNKYKERVWDILQDLETLQLCTNNVNVTGNNININQGIECMQTVIKEENKIVVEEDNGELDVSDERDKEPVRDAADKKDDKGQQAIQQPVQQPQIHTPGTPASPVQPNAPAAPITSTQPQTQSQLQPVQQSQQQTNEPQKVGTSSQIPNEEQKYSEDELKKQKYLKIVIVVILITLTLILIYFAFFDKPRVYDNMSMIHGPGQYAQPYGLVPNVQQYGMYGEPLDLYSSPHY
jgi:hypothetical protein